MPRGWNERRAVSATLVAAALAFILGSFAIPIGTLLAPGPGLVPLLLGCALLATTAAGLRAVEPAAGSDEAAGEAEAPRPRVPAILAVLALCLLGFERIGFVPMIFTCSFLLLYWLEGRSLQASLAVSLALSAGLFVLLDRVLRVSLPRGILEF